MKHRSMTLLVSLVLAAGLLGVLPAQRALAATCTASAAGNWSNAGTWSNCNSGVPTASDDVVIDSSVTVTVDADAYANNITLSGGGTGTRLTLSSSNTLSVSGTLNSDATSLSQSLITGAGVLKFVGSSRALFGSNWAANPPSWNLEIALNTGATGTVSTNVKAGDIKINSGTLDMGSKDLRADTNAQGGGVLSVASGAVLRMGGGDITRTGTASTGYFSAFTLNGTLDYYATTVGSINANAISFNGTVEYSANGAQSLVAKTSSGGGSANPDTYTDLRLGGSGAKTLKQDTAVNGTLRLAGTANLGLGSYSLTYGANSTLEYAGSSAQTTASAELPASGGPTNVTINNSLGVTLHAPRTVTGALTLSSGRLSLGNNTLTLGASATVGGTPDASKMVVTDVDGSQTGKLCKVWGSGAFTYPIGDNRGTAEYSPVTFTPTGLSGLTVCFRAVDAAHPNKPATPTTDYLTRYWSGTTSAGSFTGYTGVFTFINDSSDVVGSTANMLPKRWTGAFPWEEQNNTISGATFTWNGGAALSDFTAFKSGILAVTLAEFFAQQVSDHVLVTWETASELGNLGFNLYRGVSPAGPDRRLNDLLIPSQSLGNPGGFTYTWDDHADLVAGTTYYYWVEDVDINGVATRHGPVSVDFVAPTAVTVGRVQASPATGAAALPLAGTLLALLTPLAAAGLRRRV